MNKKLIALLSASIITVTSISTALATTQTVAPITTETSTQSNEQTTTEQKREGKKIELDTSNWSDEQKVLLETIKNRESEQTTKDAAIASLLSAGLITQEQADMLTNMPQGFGKKFQLDTTSWTDEQKVLLETIKNRESEQTTKDAAIASLLSAGLITQEQADMLTNMPQGFGKKFQLDTTSWTDEQKTLLETIKNRESEQTTKDAAIASLLSDGLITQEQADMLTKMPQGFGKKFELDTSNWSDEQKVLLDTIENRESEQATKDAAIASLLSAGLITQEQADMLTNMPQGFGKKFELDTTSWTDEQKTLLETIENRESEQTTKDAAIASLLSDGLITQEQADMLTNMPQGFGKKFQLDTSNWSDEQKVLLDTIENRESEQATKDAAIASLLSAGLITQEQADMLTNMPQGFGKKFELDTSNWSDEQKTLLETIKNRESEQTTKDAAIASLLSAGLITQEQADMLTKMQNRGKYTVTKTTASSLEL